MHNLSRKMSRKTELGALLGLYLLLSMSSTSSADAELSGWKNNSDKIREIPEGVYAEILPLQSNDQMTSTGPVGKTEGKPVKVSTDFVDWYSMDDGLQGSGEGEKEEEEEGLLGRVVNAPSRGDQNDVGSDPTTDAPDSTMVREGNQEGATGVVNDFTARENIPAHITSPLTNEMVIAMSGNLRLCCTAIGVPTPSITWYKDGQILVSGEFLRVSKDGCLYSESFTSRENGWFQCKAKNEYGVSLSQMKLIVKDVQPVSAAGHDLNTTYTPRAGQSFSLRFGDIPNTIPATLRRWYVDQNNELILNERMVVDIEGNLHFSYVTEEDSRVYLAGLVSPTAVSINLYKRGAIKVQGTIANEPDLRPVIQHKSKIVYARMYENAILECIFSGKPTPEVTWQNRSYHEITPSQKHSLPKRGRLVIHNIQQSDNGTYTCLGKNLKEEVKDEVQVVVIAPPLPVKERILAPKTVPDKKDVTLYCQTWTAAGMQNNLPIWYRNGELLSDASPNIPDRSRYTFSADYTSLTIRNLDKVVDTAAYQCNTTNPAGYLFMDGYLRVIESIEVTKRPDAHVIMIDPEEMTIVELTVEAKGDLCCPINYYWTVNGTKADFDLRPFIYDSALNRLLLNLSSVSKTELYSSMGNYVCRVSNSYEAIEVAFALQIGGVSEHSADKSGFQMWWLGIIFGILAILITILIIIIVLRSNYPHSTYKLEETELKHNLNPKEDLLNQSFQEI